MFLFKGKTPHHLSVQQKSDLLDFMKTFTDSTFLHDTAYSNPFK